MTMITTEGGWKQMLLLTIVVVIYLCAGAAIFSAIELEPELERRNVLRGYLERFIDNHTCVDAHTLNDLLEEIDYETTFARHVLKNKTVYTQWDFTGSFSFVITVVSTIGYGNLAPRTGFGKVAVVVYALFGIPITMLMLSGIGQVLTKLSTKVNKCNFCSKKPLLSKVLNMVLIITLGLTMLFGIPAFIFNQVEKWGYLEGLYFCFVTLSTIGFGDYIAAMSENRLTERGGGDVYRVVTYVWILFGLAYLSLIVNYIVKLFILRAEKMENFTKDRLENEIARLQKEMAKKKRSVYKTATAVTNNVTSGVKGKFWEMPQGDAIEKENNNKNGVQLLRVSSLKQTEKPIELSHKIEIS